MSVRRRGWTAVLAAVLVAATAVGAGAQHRPGNALNWAFGGTVHTVARAGHIAVVGGRFNAVAARHNVTGGFAVASPITSQRALRAVRVHGNVNAVVPDGAGGWFVGGNFTFVGDSRQPQLAHILANGRLDQGWNGRVNGRVLALAVVGGTLYVGGEFTQAGSGPGALLPASRANFAAFDAVTGGLKTTATGGADAIVTTLAASGTTLYAGGNFATFGAQGRIRLAAYDTTTDTVLPWNPGADGLVREIVPAPGGVFVGGAFSNAGGATRAFLAQIDATTGLATTWNPGASDAVTALALVGDVLYVGGQFTQLAGTARNHAGAVHALTGALQTWDPNADDTVLAFSVSGTTLYMGGEFLNVGGNVRLHTAAVDLTTGRLTTWHPATNDPVRVIASAAANVALGGSFEALGAHARLNLAAVDLDTGRLLPWRPAPNGAVLALTVARDRRVYVGGAFTTIAGQTRDHLAAFDLATRTLTSWNPGADANVLALTSVTDSSNVTTVYAGGDFANAGGQARSRVAAIDGASGLALAGFIPGATNDSVLTLDANQNLLYVGGKFTTLAGASMPYLGRLDRLTGAVDATWAPAPDALVRSVHVSNGLLYAGGGFTSIAGVPRAHVAALGHAAPAVATAWQPNPDRDVHVVRRDGPFVFLGGAFRTVDSTVRPRLASVLAGAVNAEPYLLPWRPQWYGLVHTLDARLEGVLAGGEALPDLDDQEVDPVGRVAFYPRAGVPGRPGAPTNLHTFTNGGQVGVEWGPPLHGAEPRFYLLEVGSTPGANDVITAFRVDQLFFDASGVPPGTYYLRVRAVSAGGIGPASNEVELVVGPSTCAANPEPPTDLEAVVNGGTVTITWTESVTPGVTGYKIAANPFGVGSFFSTLVPAGTTTFSAPAPPGVFEVRVRAISACGASEATNDVVLGVGGATLPPGAPEDLTTTVNGSAVTFTWSAPLTGGTAAGYVLEAGTGPGLSDIARVPLAGTTLTAPNVPAGAYYIRVRAVNGAGLGEASEEVQLIVP